MGWLYRGEFRRVGGHEQCKCLSAWQPERNISNDFYDESGPQHRDSIDYEHPYDSMRRYAELLALQHDCARPRHSYYRAMRVLHEHFLGEHPAHPRRGGKPEVKERRYPPLDGALGVRPMSAAASAFNAYAVA